MYVQTYMLLSRELYVLCLCVCVEFVGYVFHHLNRALTALLLEFDSNTRVIKGLFVYLFLHRLIEP